jgi:hypothetical protein
MTDARPQRRVEDPPTVVAMIEQAIAGSKA